MNRMLLTACALLPAVLQAQTPELQQIATATAVSTERLGVITNVRELPDGRLLVNDMMRRRVFVMDTTMKVVGAVLDSVSAAANYYGASEGVLLPYRGDTTFFVDPQSYAIVVIDPQGKPTRVRSVWRVQDVRLLSSTMGPNGFPGPDAKGRIVYRLPAQPAPPRVRPSTGVPWIPQEPDSAFVVAVDLNTRKLDTLAVLRTPKVEMRIRRQADRGWTVDRITNPLPIIDEWAVLPDGTVAIVRGREYRVDYLRPDGARTSSERIPFDWQRLSDDDKERLADSAKTAQQKFNMNMFVSSMIRWVNQYNQLYPTNFTVPEGFVLQPGFPKDWLLPKGVSFPENYVFACAPGVDRVAAMQGGNSQTGMPSCLPAPIAFSGGMTPPMPVPRPALVPPASELPDYRPAFPPGSVRADAEGNLWVRVNPMKPTPGGPVFDVISPAGRLIAKYQLPVGYAIVGFGQDRVIYLTMRDARGLHLARVRLK